MRKSLLKTAVSAVIVGAVVALSSVAVFAETPNFAEVYPNNKTGSELSSLTVSGLGTAGSLASNSFTFTDGTSFVKDATTGDAVDKFGLSAVKRFKNTKKDGDTVTPFTITPSVSGKAYIYLYANTNTPSEEQYLDVFQNDSKIVEKFTPTGKGTSTNVKILTFDVEKDKTYSIADYNATLEVHVLGIGIEANSNNTYVWDVNNSALESAGFEGTVSVTGTGKTVQLSYDGTDYELLNSYKSVTANDDTAVNNVVSTTITPQTSWFKVAGTADKVTTATTVTFKDGLSNTSADKEALSDGEVFGTYFTAVGTDVIKRSSSNGGAVENVELKVGSGKIRFETDDDFIVTLKYSSTGKSDSNVSSVAFLSSDGTTEIKSGTTTATSNAGNASTLTVNLPKGVYYIAANDSTVQSNTRIHTISFITTIANSVTSISGDDFYAEGMVNDGTCAYIIHGVTDDELKGDELALTEVKYAEDANGTDISTVSTTSVYTKVRFADNSYVEAGVGKFADYDAIYAIGFNYSVKTDGLTLTWLAQ